MQRALLIVAATCTSMLAVGAGLAQSPSADHAPAYAGSREGCRKCHLREFRGWEKTPHAGALDVLEAGDRADPACLQCHVTGLGEPGGFRSPEETPDLAGVGCEACHGPGSDYRDRETMKDRAASVAAGLRLPDETTCRSCHNASSPTFAGDFDYEQRKADGVHALRRR